MKRVHREAATVAAIVVMASAATQAAAGALWDQLSTQSVGSAQASASRGAPIAISYFQDTPCASTALRPVALRKTPRPVRVRHRRRARVVRHVHTIHRPHRRRHAAPARIARAPARSPRCEVLRRDSLYGANVSPESGLYSLVSQPVAPQAPIAQEVAPTAARTQAYNFPFTTPFPNQYGGGGGGGGSPIVKAPGTTGGGTGTTTGGGAGTQPGGTGTTTGGDTTGGGGGEIVSSPSAAPEPQSWAMMIFGVAMIGNVLRACKRERTAL